MKKLRVPTIICKRVDAHGTPFGGQWAYNRDLTSYMANPESRFGTEKCVATFGFGFTHPEMTAEEAAVELSLDCELAALDKPLKSNAVDHWVMSFSDTGMDIPLSKIKSTVEGWLVDMGYVRFHKIFAAVHADTDNLHCHMAVCRVNALTGQIRYRGWWKLDNQMALVRAAKAEGWRLEEGSDYFICPRNTRPEPVIVKDPIFRTEEKIFRPKVVSADRWKAAYSIGGKKKRKTPHIGDGASRLEHFEGEKSGKSILCERLSGVLDALPENPSWPDVHMALARLGALIEKREHGKRAGLALSLDGETWTPAGKVSRELTWTSLSKRLGSDFIPADPEIISLASNIRGTARLAENLKENDMTLTQSQISLLRGVSPDEAREAFLKAGEKETNPAADCKNAIDVAMKRFGHDFQDGVQTLARLFPDVLKREGRIECRSVMEVEEAARTLAEKRGLNYTQLDMNGDRPKKDHLYHTRRRILEQFAALRVDRMDIFAKVPETMQAANNKRQALMDNAMRRAFQDGAVSGVTKEDYEIAEAAGYFDDIPEAVDERNRTFRNVPVEEAFRLAPQLMYMSGALGGVGPENAVNIFCGLRWPDDRVGILINDFRAGHWDAQKNSLEAESFLKECPPTAVLATSDGFPQVFYVTDRKYEPGFYEMLSGELNRKFGDRTITGLSAQSRLAGFFNQNEERHAAQFRTKKAYDRNLHVVEITRSTTTAPGAFEAYVDKRHAQWVKEGKPLSGRQVKDAFEKGLKEVELDRAVYRKGMKLQKFMKNYLAAERGEDRSVVDYRTACGLYLCGAKPNEVFTFIREHGLQNGEWVQRGSQKNWVRNVRSDAEMERKARRTAMNANRDVKGSHIDQRGLDERWMGDWRGLVSPIAREGVSISIWEREGRPAEPVSAEQKARIDNLAVRRGQRAIARPKPVSPEMRQMIAMQDAEKRNETQRLDVEIREDYRRDLERVDAVLAGKEKPAPKPVSTTMRRPSGAMI